MEKDRNVENLTQKLAPQKQVDKEWFLSLLNEEGQLLYESDRLKAVMKTLRLVRLRPLQSKILRAKQEIAEIERERDGAAGYRKILGLLAQIKVT
ncbi:MAG: hypothetical protein IJV80_04665, partial [Clostridia bacterium]|nr:hypothetical protein [Clostridia bacterium]